MKHRKRLLYSHLCVHSSAFTLQYNFGKNSRLALYHNHFSSDYTSYIEESQTEPNPVVIVTANDPDSNSQVAYSIVADPTNLWQIDRTTGKVTAKQAIYYSDTPGNQGL